MKMSPSKRSAEDGDYRAELSLSLRCCSCEFLAVLGAGAVYMYMYMPVSFSWAIYVDKDVRHVCVSVRYIFGLAWFRLTLVQASPSLLSLHLRLSAAVSQYICMYTIYI